MSNYSGRIILIKMKIRSMFEVPEINKIKTLDFPDYKTISLDNGIPLVVLQAPNPDIVKMDIVFYAGRFREKQRAIAKATATLLKEGTSSMNSSEIARKIDYYGATITTSGSMDTATISIYSLGKYFKNILPIITDILTKATFPEIELKKYKSRVLEKLKAELTKNDVLAYRHFTEKIYGENHPYGYNTIPADYINIDRKSLQTHYYDHYTPDNCKIFITGNITDKLLKSINNRIGNIRGRKTRFKNKKYSLPKISSSKYQYQNDRIHQTAIRIGRRLFNRSHQDYASMYLLNTILGGYFGSRLSSNLREDKGYTYGVYSSLDMMLKDGYFMISTEVGNKYLNDTFKEIYKEIDTLLNTPVEDKELQLVKNYIRGNFLSMVNGNLNSLNLIKTIELSGLKKTFFKDFIQVISDTNSTKLLEMANKYIKPEYLTEVRVGNT